MLEKIAGLIPVNWELLRNPVNWIIVFLMLALAGLMLGVILQNGNAINNETAE